jgi:hypothetical protein
MQRQELLWLQNASDVIVLKASRRENDPADIGDLMVV